MVRFHCVPLFSPVTVRLLVYAFPVGDPRSGEGAAVAEWLSSWLAEQEDRGSIPGLAI